MRLWSLHPRYLDTKGLLAVWREGLLAKNVIEGKTKGYTKHPQLIRFKSHSSPKNAINYYLHQIFLESINRSYKFDKSKLIYIDKISKIKVTTKQVDYELKHLKNKLKLRDSSGYKKLQTIEEIKLNPLFTIIPGEIESWEIV
ncbi:pyrimidine dimer DNA glycosylase/endonuclease V [Patescibacteria group bacterium]